MNAAKLHGRTLAVLGHDVSYQKPGCFVEDMLIEGEYDLLVTNIDFVNRVSGRPIVRHIRDHERENKRRLIEMQEMEFSQKKKTLAKDSQMVNAHNIAFPSTHIPEDRTASHDIHIRLQSLEVMRSFSEQRKQVDDKILTNVGLRKSKSTETLDFFPSPSRLDITRNSTPLVPSSSLSRQSDLSSPIPFVSSRPPSSDMDESRPSSRMNGDNANESSRPSSR